MEGPQRKRCGLFLFWMLKKLFLALFLGAILSDVGAQPIESLPRTTVPIPYIRLVPSSIRTHPKTPYQSKFYGRFRVQQEIAIHCYNAGNLGGVEPTPEEKALGWQYVQEFKVDIFAKTKGRWKSLNSVQVRYDAFNGGPPVRFGANFLYLHEKNKTAPILLLNCYDPEGAHGDIGNQIALVFLEGWTKAATAQAFGYGGVGGGEGGGQDLRFERDPRGTLQVRIAYNYNSNENSYQELWRWNGQRFALSEKIPYNDKRFLGNF